MKAIIDEATVSTKKLDLITLKNDLCLDSCI